MPPPAIACIGHDAHHVTVFCLDLGIIKEMGHHQRGEDAIFLGSLGNVSKGSGVALTAVTSAHRTDIAILAVLIP